MDFEKSIQSKKHASIKMRSRNIYLTDFTGSQCNIPKLVDKFSELIDIEDCDEKIRNFSFSLYNKNRFSANKLQFNQPKSGLQELYKIARLNLYDYHDAKRMPDILDELAYCDFTQEYESGLLSTKDILNLLKLSQFNIQYLTFTQKYLIELVGKLGYHLDRNISEQKFNKEVNLVDSSSGSSTGSFNCQYCPKLFSTFEYLEKHKIRRHSVDLTTQKRNDKNLELKYYKYEDNNNRLSNRDESVQSDNVENFNKEKAETYPQISSIGINETVYDKLRANQMSHEEKIDRIFKEFHKNIENIVQKNDGKVSELLQKIAKSEALEPLNSRDVQMENDLDVKNYFENIMKRIESTLGSIISINKTKPLDQLTKSESETISSVQFIENKINNIIELIRDELRQILNKSEENSKIYIHNFQNIISEKFEKLKIDINTNNKRMKESDLKVQKDIIESVNGWHNLFDNFFEEKLNNFRKDLLINFENLLKSIYKTKISNEIDNNYHCGMNNSKFDKIECQISKILEKITLCDNYRQNKIHEKEQSIQCNEADCIVEYPEYNRPSYNFLPSHLDKQSNIKALYKMKISQMNPIFSNIFKGSGKRSIFKQYQLEHQIDNELKSFGLVKNCRAIEIDELGKCLNLICNRQREDETYEILLRKFKTKINKFQSRFLARYSKKLAKFLVTNQLQNSSHSKYSSKVLDKEEINRVNTLNNFHNKSKSNEKQIYPLVSQGKQTKCEVDVQVCLTGYKTLINKKTEVSLSDCEEKESKVPHIIENNDLDERHNLRINTNDHHENIKEKIFKDNSMELLENEKQQPEIMKEDSLEKSNSASLLSNCTIEYEH